MATERSKHLDMAYRYTRQRIAVHMDAALRCNESAEYLGDMNTEALPRSVSEHWATLGLVDAEYEDPRSRRIIASAEYEQRSRSTGRAWA